MEKNYIFSYGSLINKDSLELTIGKDKASEAKTVVLEGYARGWRNHVHHENRTGLGIIEKQGAQVNGIVFEVDEDYFIELDKREYGFERRRLNTDGVVDGILWAYFVKDPNVPTDEYPVALTYIDTVLAGCLTQGEEFTREFVRLTVNWEYPIINDRDDPIFPRRAILDKESLSKVDLIIKEELPKVYEKII